jgi:spermidine synthase
MKRVSILFPVKCILAFCSIVYELILAQSLSAFLDNTVLRYSVTIGLYMFAMGVGSMLAEGRLTRHPLLNLLRLEILLTIIGGFSVIGLHFLDGMQIPYGIFTVLSHGMIVVIGVLTGFELPLVIAGAVSAGRTTSENALLAWDYFGALLGTVCFAFLLLPRMGLVIGALNAIAGSSLWFVRDAVDTSVREEFKVYAQVQWVVLAILLVCLAVSPGIVDIMTQMYLSR